ncbi:bifunctional DNA primase/polymerase [Streptomyces albipurpureus]|uniref:Bifunctional DNA primase/polymerase n=1 Tax=Streptomyces albipurpureus TaxID=2897419 RepID=A0ABT0UXZ2_9ACTN|nr:bifunctional DNA primase/polymerase [Streptomyces sp. CWNU-1]MCM2392975.1 bifunctional DNA primase/polymerase [Streptomyces sp. CWNU-1]
MGFTIGSSRGIRDIRSGSRRRGRTAECTVVAEYTGLWGWAVVPGARAVSGVCSCGEAGCTAPGAHPLSYAQEIPAGATLDEVTRAWSQVPEATLLLPVGRTFDILDVAAPAGRRALVRLERMGLPLGPVSATPDGRCQFFVAPGAARDLPELLYRMGWDDADLDLHCLGPGDYITAAPSDRAGLGPVSWLRPPTLDMAYVTDTTDGGDAPSTSAAPPEARLLLGTLAYICHRSTM